jgi:DNA-binding CsgD family transcriptional regulator
MTLPNDPVPRADGPPEQPLPASSSGGALPFAVAEDGGEDETTRRLVPLLVAVLVLVVVGGVTDLVLDRPTTWRSLHVAFEVGIVLVSLTFAVVLWRGWWTAAHDLRRMRATLAATTRSLAERQAEQETWRRRAEAERASFGRAIDAQFTAWGLTPTEREIASLLLQGHGHKQIAARTGRGDRTVRQHAVSIYEKSGLGGRSEFAAFFLQDLLPADVPQAGGTS